MTAADLPMLILVLVLAIWLGTEFYLLSGRNRVLERRVDALVDAQAKSAFLGQQTSREEQISQLRGNRAAAKAIEVTLTDLPTGDPVVALNVDQARATIAATTERLRFLGVEV